jgi:hypothetical protein
MALRGRKLKSHQIFLAHSATEWWSVPHRVNRLRLLVTSRLPWPSRCFSPLLKCVWFITWKTRMYCPGGTGLIRNNRPEWRPVQL